MPFRTKPYGIKTMNKISSKGLSLFGADYEISDSAATPDAILVRSTTVDTDAFAGLLAVARAGAGVNNISIDKASAKGICVFNTPGANANAVAELVFAGIGAVARNLHKGYDWTKTLGEMTNDEEISKAVEKGKSQFNGWELQGRTLGVIGLGKIGVLVANGGVARGMAVVAYEPYPSPANMHMLHPSVKITNNLEEVLRASEVLSLHVPLTPNTKNLINAYLISVLPEGALLLNFSRNGIIDEQAMIAALESKQLSGYVTDFPTQATLKRADCLNLPHLGASTDEAEDNCATMAAEQLKLYMEHGIVQNSVNFPSVEGKPSHGTKTRFVVINRDVPNMIAGITKLIGDAGYNIQSFKNQSNGKIGYNLIDLETAVTKDLVDKMLAVENVLKVRVIEY